MNLLKETESFIAKYKPECLERFQRLDDKDKRVVAVMLYFHWQRKLAREKP